MELPAQLEFTHAWRELQQSLRTAVGESVYSVWFSELAVVSWDGKILILRAKPGTERFIGERFGRVIDRCGQRCFGPHVAISFESEPAADVHRAITASSLEHTDALLRDQPFVPRYSFDQFIIGDGNRLAHAAALAVAEAPGAAYNPLFLHSPPGMGKTHLLHAIGNYIRSFEPDKTVRYTTVEAFTNSFITALHGRALDRFKELYRGVDVLLVDDIQFLESKVKTEEEFFHTFNALHDSGRQLVLTCDRIPAALTNLEQRLRERLEAGLVAHITAPDYNTRLTILAKRAQLDAIPVADQAVLELIAERVKDNVRQLEGALIRIVANHSLTGRPLDVNLAASVLDELFPATNTTAGQRAKTPEEIMRVVAQHFSLSVEQLTSASRKSEIAWARQLAIHLCRELTDLPLSEIGQRCGGRNHATVLHACKRVAQRTAINSEDRDAVESLVQQLSESRIDCGS